MFKITFHTDSGFATLKPSRFRELRRPTCSCNYPPVSADHRSMSDIRRIVYYCNSVCVEAETTGQTIQERVTWKRLSHILQYE